MRYLFYQKKKGKARGWENIFRLKVQGSGLWQRLRRKYYRRRCPKVSRYQIYLVSSAPLPGRCPVEADRAQAAGKTDEKSGEVRGTCGESVRSSPRMTNKKDAVTYVTASFFQGEHSISRVLSHLRGDDYLSSQPIARLLKRRNPEGQRATSTLPYSVLLRMGFTKPAGLPTAGALLPHLSTLTTCVAVSFSMALSLGSLPPDVIRHPALRSSDFPHALRPAIIFPARVLQYSMETEFFQEKD